MDLWRRRGAAMVDSDTGVARDAGGQVSNQRPTIGVCRPVTWLDQSRPAKKGALGWRLSQSVGHPPNSTHGDGTASSFALVLSLWLSSESSSHWHRTGALYCYSISRFTNPCLLDASLKSVASRSSKQQKEQHPCTSGHDAVVLVRICQYSRTVFFCEY